MLYHARQLERRPAYMSEEIWTAWNAKWTSEDFRKKSRTARKNRMTEPGGPGSGISTHRGGTRSVFDHGLHLAAQGREEDEIPFAVYNILHCKGGVYDNEKSAAVAEEYTRRVAEMSQPLPDGSVPANVNKPQILCNAAGGISDRGRLYGFGSQANTFKASSSSRSHNNYDSDSAKLRRKVAELKEQLQKQAADSEARIVEQAATLKAHEEQLQKQAADSEARIVEQAATLKAHEAQLQQFKAMFEQFMNGSTSTPPS